MHFRLCSTDLKGSELQFQLQDVFEEISSQDTVQGFKQVPVWA